MKYHVLFDPLKTLSCDYIFKEKRLSIKYITQIVLKK